MQVPEEPAISPSERASATENLRGNIRSEYILLLSKVTTTTTCSLIFFC